MPEWRWWWLECSKNESQNARAWLRLVKRFGNVGEYFNVLNWASLKGLSLLTWGRLWDCSTPRSARSWLTVLDVIDDPRSACRERSEEHTSELQFTNAHLVCSLLLEKKK